MASAAASFESDKVDAWDGGSSFEFNGLLRLWRLLEADVGLLIDVGCGYEPTFPDNGKTVQHCFEPDPDTRLCLAKFQRANLVVNHMAVGSKDAKDVTLYTHAGCGSLHPRTLLGCFASCKCARSVSMTTLDNYCSERKLTAVDLLSVSASGHELEVLRGASATLKSTSMVLFEYGATYSETGAKLHQVLDLLRLSGFGVFFRVAGGSLVSITKAVDNSIYTLILAARGPLPFLLRLIKANGMGRVPSVTCPTENQRFEPISSIPHAGQTAICAVGFNMSMIATPDGYLASIRRKQQTQRGTDNECLLMMLDSKFAVKNQVQTAEKCERTRYPGFTNGFEDCRLIDDSSLLGVLCDSTADHVPTVAFARFSKWNGEISEITPLTVEGVPIAPQKNWLVLRRWGKEFHLLHDTNPLRIVRVNVADGPKRGVGCVVKEVVHSALNQTSHNAAAVQLPDGRFLVAIRQYRRRQYTHSRWLLLSTNYDLVGISPPFRFQNVMYYEMCMSLSIDSANTFLVAAVSLEDRFNHAFTLLLSTLLHSIKPQTHPHPP